jgi:hypothetical protein
MPFSLTPDAQLYGSNQFKAFKQAGATPDGDRHFFADRIANYGIFSFGAMTANQKKRVVLATANITSPILLRSVYAFGANPTNDEIKLRLFSGTTQLAEMTLLSADMPYQFPDGAIIDPAYSIEIETRYATTQLNMYWQPVNIIDYLAIT